VGAPLLIVDATLLGANFAKVLDGGWLPLAIGAASFVVLTTWHRGRGVVRRHREHDVGALRAYVEELGARRPALPRLPGTAVFLDADPTTTPLALRAHVERLHALQRE
jgi:KUP system potassium uptake protein